MKKYLPFLIMIFLSRTSFSQNEAEAYKEKNLYAQAQLGFNVTSFIRQFTNFNNNNVIAINTPYDVNAKLLFSFWKFRNKGWIGLRGGYGYLNTDVTTKTETLERENTNKTNSYRFGIEYQFVLTKRWLGYFGFDYIGESVSSEITAVS